MRGSMATPLRPCMMFCFFLGGSYHPRDAIIQMGGRFIHRSTLSCLPNTETTREQTATYTMFDTRSAFLGVPGRLVILLGARTAVRSTNYHWAVRLLLWEFHGAQLLYLCWQICFEVFKMASSTLQNQALACPPHCIVPFPSRPNPPLCAPNTFYE